jgi:hypothetical protein
VGRCEQGADEWLRRGERHLGLVGATEDAAAVRVLLDVRLAFTGDEDAVRRLRGAVETGQLAEREATSAHLGLAQLRIRQERYDEARAHAETVSAIAAGLGMPVPQARALVRVAVAVLYLQMAAAGALDDGEQQAVALLIPAGTEAHSSHDIPVIGAWALGGAALAAHRGDTGRARALWALGVRLGATVVYLFRQGYGERLTAALGSEEDGEPLLAAWRERPVAEATERIDTLMGALLG